MARKSTKKEKSGFHFDYAATIADVEKQFSLSTGSMSIEAKRHSFLSTGLFSTDLMLGGGILPGAWYTFFGGEGSAKSTHLMHISQAAINAGVPLLSYDDFEGSLDPEYFEAMMTSSARGMKFKDVFGVQDPTTGEYVIEPKIRKREPDTAEQFFNPARSLLKRLPDKRFIKGTWFYVFDNTKANRAIVGNNYSQKLFSKYNQFFVEAENGLPQVIFFVDSYPAMYPDRLDDDDAGSGMAAVARMFSENVPKVLPKLKPKAAVIIGVNQLRLRPGFTMGNPEYEPAGETVKFASSVRVRQAARSVPHGKGPIEEERSVMGEGTDSYKYIHMKAIKNKKSTPYLEAWQRVWTKDADGRGRGFDPVWDTFYYMKATGQIEGTMKKLKMPEIAPKKVFQWSEFKQMILLPKGKERDKALKKMGLKQDPKLRQICADQIRKGKAMPMYFDQMKKQGGGDDDE